MMAIGLAIALGLSVPSSRRFQADEVIRKRHTLPVMSVS
jgi:hypothetical protein